MPAGASGRKSCIPKLPEGGVGNKRGLHERGEEGHPSSEKRQYRSRSPIQRRRKGPQDNGPNIDPAVSKAYGFMKQKCTPEELAKWLTFMKDVYESAEEGAHLWNCRAQSPPADKRRRISTHPPDKEEHTRSPRAGRGHGSRAARGDECASGPKTHASHGRGGPRRDGELKTPQPKGSAKKRDPIIKPAPARAVRMSPSQNPERRKGRQPEEEDKELRSPSTINDSSLSDSDSSSKAESPRPSSRSRSRSSSGSLKASGRSARREPARPPLQNQAPKGPDSQSPVVLTSAETKTPAVGKKKEGSFSPAVAGHSKNPPPPPPPPKRPRAGPAPPAATND